MLPRAFLFVVLSFLIAQMGQAAADGAQSRPLCSDRAREFAPGCPSLANVQDLVFVAGRNIATVEAISVSNAKAAGRVDLGIVPSQLKISDTLAKLAAIDGVSKSLTVVDLATGTRETAALPIAPTRLILMADARTALIANDSSGDIVLYNLASMREKGRFVGPAGILDLMPSSDGLTIFIAAKSVEGVAVHDASSGERKALIGKGRSLSLARSQIGTNGYLLSAAGPDRFLTRFDLKTRAVREETTITNVAMALYPAVGKLVLADPVSGRLTTLPAEGWAKPAVISTVPNIDAVYSAFFDTLALTSSGNKVLVYDIENETLLGRILLSGKPGPGVVTPESLKLYLPVESARQLIEVDAATKRITAEIELDFAPSFATMARGHGICH